MTERGSEARADVVREGAPALWLLGLLTDFVIAARRRFRITAAGLGFALVAGVAVAFMLPQSFPAEAEFLPDTETAPSSLSAALQGFASQLGGLASIGDSPQFYGDLLQNRRILLSLLYKTYPAAVLGENTDMRLIESLGIARPDTPRSREEGLATLKKMVSFTVDPRTAVIHFQVDAATPALAVALVKDLLDAVNGVNIQIRQSRAEANLKFLRDQVTQAEGEMNRAEDNIRLFQTVNRDFNSPRLKYEQTRLERAYNLSTEVYMAQRRALDEAAEQSARNTPTLIVLEEPLPVTRASAPNRRLVVASALLFGLLLTMAWLRIVEAPLFRGKLDREISWTAELQRLRTLSRAPDRG